MFNGSLKDGVKFQTLVFPTMGTASTTLYNGSAVSVTGNGFDCVGHDECTFWVNAGTMYSTSALDISIVGSSSNDPSGATVVSKNNTAGTSTPATFTQITSGSNSTQLGSVKTKMAPRYLWVRSYQGSATVNFSAGYIAGKSDTLPQGQTYTFDIGY